MPIDQTVIHRSMRNISRLSIVVALFALVLIGVLYATLYRKGESSAQNTNLPAGTLSAEELRQKNSTYEESVASIIAQFNAGTLSAEQAIAQLTANPVTSTYKSVHVQLMVIMQSEDSATDKQADIRNLDAAYPWLIP